MSAPKKNKFWQLRSKHGRDKIFSSPDSLWCAVIEYFKWCDNNPWFKHEAVKSGKLSAQILDIPIQRPYTLGGLCLFLDVDEQTIENYSKKEEYKDFFGIIYRIKKTIYTQKFEGAVVGAFNANIISRDLGLIDKVESKNTNYNYTSEKLAPEKIKQISKALEEDY